MTSHNENEQTAAATILIVDDTPENLRLLSTILLKRGYQVRAVTNGAMALMSARLAIPDLVLLDINMPGEDGFTVCQQLKADPRTCDVPVIFISAMDDVQDKVYGFQVGGVDYITKPFQVEEVLARIENQLTLQYTRAALQRSEEQFRLLAENAQDVIFRYRFQDPRGFVYISPSVTRVMGFAPEDYYADPDLDLKRLHPESLPQFGVLMHGNSDNTYDEPIMMRYVRKDGRDVWLEQTHRVILDERGQTLAIEGISRDITERKRAEEQLKQAYHDMKVLNDRLQSELHMAQRIQHSLLPPASPAWPELDVACYSMPAQEVGGDWYAYHRYTGVGVLSRTFAVAVGDVSGKGMPAALLMAISLGMFQSLVEQQPDPPSLLESMDVSLEGYTRTTRQNCTLTFLEVALIDDEQPADAAHAAIVRAVNAGGIAPLLKRQNGTVEWVPVGGLPLGIGVEITDSYRQVELALTTGDMLVLTSDGVVEMQNEQGALFGFERLEQAVASAPHTSADALLSAVLNDLEQFVEKVVPHDDVTIVVVHLQATTPPRYADETGY